MSIDCKDWCKDKQTIIHNLQKNNSDGHNNEQIKFAVTDYHLCMMGCENRNRHRDGGGKRKKYVNKTKSVRYRTRRRVTPRIYRTHMNNRKKTARR